MARMKFRKETLPTVFTTGEVAELCQVAARTVGKWFDAGKLKGYRIPGSCERRIPRDELLQFLKDYGITHALEALQKGWTIVTHGVPPAWTQRLQAHLVAWPVREVVCMAALGERCAVEMPAAVVLDTSAGRQEAVLTARWLQTLTPTPLVVLLWPEDSEMPAGQPGLRHLRQPVAPEQVAVCLGSLPKQVSA